MRLVEIANFVHQIKIMLLKYCLLGLLVFSLFGCETEVDLNAPYEKYTSVYGILDLSADTQFVRVNKSFLGAGSAFDFAQVKDSSEYDSDEIQVFIEFGNQSIQLEPHNVNRQPGIFYDENVMVFIATNTQETLVVNSQGNPINLETQYSQLPNEYRLVVKVDGKTITATTEPTYLLLYTSFVSPVAANNNFPNWGSVSPLGTDLFNPQLLKMKGVPPGERYEARIIFNYNDHLVTSGEVIPRSIEFELGSHMAALGSDDPFELAYSPEEILNQIANTAECDGVAYRTLGDVEFVMMVAGEDLSRYITVNNPVTGVVTERPEFSNIEGENAFGLFSSRYKIKLTKTMAGSSLDLIMEGETTGQLCFCVDSPGTSFPCPDINSECNCN